MPVSLAFCKARSIANVPTTWKHKHNSSVLLYWLNPLVQFHCNHLQMLFLQIVSQWQVWLHHCTSLTLSPERTKLRTKKEYRTVSGRGWLTCARRTYLQLSELDYCRIVNNSVTVSVCKDTHGVGSVRGCSVLASQLRLEYAPFPRHAALKLLLPSCIASRNQTPPLWRSPRL